MPHGPRQAKISRNILNKLYYCRSLEKMRPGKKRSWVLLGKVVPRFSLYTRLLRAGTLSGTLSPAPSGPSLAVAPLLYGVGIGCGGPGNGVPPFLKGPVREYFCGQPRLYHHGAGPPPALRAIWHGRDCQNHDRPRDRPRPRLWLRRNAGQPGGRKRH